MKMNNGLTEKQMLFESEIKGEITRLDMRLNEMPMKIDEKVRAIELLAETIREKQTEVLKETIDRMKDEG